MKRMSRQEQLPLQFRRPPGLDEPEIKLLVGPINFIAHNRMAGRGQVHTNLVSAAGKRDGANQTESIFAGKTRFVKPPFNVEISPRGRSCRINRLLQPDGGLSMFTLSIKWRVDNFDFPFRPAPNNRKVFLL